MRFIGSIFRLEFRGFCLLFACRSIPPYSGISVSSSGYVVGCHLASTTQL